MYGAQAVQLFLKGLPEKAKILDIGAGRDRAFADKVKRAGHEYEALDWADGHDWEAPGLLTSKIQRYDGVWMSHVLEHLLDTHSALRKIHLALKPGGMLAITVPPAKDAIVGGHVSLWNAGLLVYRLILAGFDCSTAAVKTYGYNISVVVRRVPIDLPPLKRDMGDIETLAPYFPVDVRHGFDGKSFQANWP